MANRIAPKCLELLNGRIRIDCAMLDQVSQVRTGRSVLLAGSLIEGLGNPSSDLDVYSIGEALPRLEDFRGIDVHRLISPDRRILRSTDGPASEVLLAQVALPGSVVKVDVEFKTFRSIALLSDKFDEMHDYASRNLVLLSRRFESREEDFIMRWQSARPYAGSAQAIHPSFDREKYLYLAYRWIASDFGMMLDLMGAWANQDLELAVDLAREIAISQMLGFLHLNGMLSLRRKWLLKQLDRHLPDQPEIRARFKRVFFFDRLQADSASQKAYVVEALGLVEELFERSHSLLIRNGTCPVGEPALALLALDRDTSKSSFADLEFDFRSKVYGRTGLPLHSYLEQRL